MDRHVLLKVVKSAPRYTETALDEIKLLQRPITSSTAPIAPTPASPKPTENLLGLIEQHQNKGVPMHLVEQIAKQVLLGLDYMHRCCGVIHAGEYPHSSTAPSAQGISPRWHPILCVPSDGSHPLPDLKPENVFICIDNVDSIIQSELASTSTSPATIKLVGIPPSKGRGGNQTPTRR